MRRAVLVTAILMIVFLMAPLNQMQAAANPIMRYHVDVLSPESYGPYTDTNVDIQLYATSLSSKIVELSYSLDGSPRKPLNITVYPTSWNYVARGTLSNLTNGSHSLEAYAVNSQGETVNNSATFLVNTSFTYPAFLLSPSNISYIRNDVPLTFTTNSTLDQSARLNVEYRLDDTLKFESKDSKVNTTVTGLSDGQHKIIAEAFYEVTNSSGFYNIFYSAQITYFTINTSKNGNSPIPTPIAPELSWVVLLPLFLSILFVAVIFRHRKTANLKQ